MLAAIAAVDQGEGVVLIVKNYEGDVMNFEMAAEMADGRCAAVITDDDVAVETSTYSTGRRGVAGTLIVEKILGAAAELGMKRPELQALGQAVNRRTRSMGVALTSCTVPAAGKPNFDLGEKEIEMGVGIHGEPGRRRVALASAHDIIEEMVKAILVDLKPKRGAEAILFVNGFGGTPLIELYLLYHEASRMIADAGLKAARSLVGSYVTSLDMAGASITLSLLEDGAAELWDQPVHTPALRWGM